MLKRCLASTLLICEVSLFGASPAEKGADPDSIRTVNTPREFPKISSADEWRARAKEIREQILISAGLWPMPEKKRLEPHIFGKIERDGYSVEKVYFQTLPGFYLAGNLYRPIGHGKGPFPGVLNPHGHWKKGRLADTKDGSIPARCIGFARQGMVAFSYDMVGFNDTRFANSPTNLPFYDVHRQFGTNRADQLWSISLMGLQTWNCIRALDFLESLPDVDRKRLACTGESGGGTQTYTLGAIDNRLAAQAPVVMVSHTMQGGCSCENMPGLRVEYSNMEIAAAAAPRPQILVAATGDWTKTTLTMEGPAIAHIYDLLQASNKLRYVRFDYGHNYNQTSREAVYEWFDKWLLSSSLASCKEAPYQKEPDADLRVFPNRELPKDAVGKEQVISELKALHQKQFDSLVPHTRRGFWRFQRTLAPAWEHTLQLSSSSGDHPLESDKLQSYEGFKVASLNIERAGKEITLAKYWKGAHKNRKSSKVVLVLTEQENIPDEGTPSGVSLRLLQEGFDVVPLNYFRPGAQPNLFTNFYTTYNRTPVQGFVRDVAEVAVAALMHAPSSQAPSRLIILGCDRAGLVALLAAPLADAVAADCQQLDTRDDENLLATDLFCPGIRNIGAFEGPPMLAAPHPLLLHNTGANFTTDALKITYKTARSTNNLRIEPKGLSDEELVKWISKL